MKNNIVILGDMKIILVGIHENKPNMIDLQKIGKLLGSEWGELFYSVLGCPKADDYLNTDDFEIYTKRNELSFRNTISDFPLLSELHDIYGRILFSLEQVAELRKEVSRALSKSNGNELAVSGLKKIMDSCEQAQKQNKYLYFNGA
jgi:hypothetical protein